MLEKYNPSDWPPLVIYWYVGRGDREERYSQDYEYWNALSATLAYRYGFDALLYPDDMARVRETLGWDRQTVARAILDLIWPDLAHWEPQPDGTVLFHLGLPPELHPLMAAAVDSRDGRLEVDIDLTAQALALRLPPPEAVP